AADRGKTGVSGSRISFDSFLSSRMEDNVETHLAVEYWYLFVADSQVGLGEIGTRVKKGSGHWIKNASQLLACEGNIMRAWSLLRRDGDLAHGAVTKGNAKIGLLVPAGIAQSVQRRLRRVLSQITPARCVTMPIVKQTAQH